MATAAMKDIQKYSDGKQEIFDIEKWIEKCDGCTKEISMETHRRKLQGLDENFIIEETLHKFSKETIGILRMFEKECSGKYSKDLLEFAKEKRLTFVNKIGEMKKEEERNIRLDDLIGRISELKKSLEEEERLQRYNCERGFGRRTGRIIRCYFCREIGHKHYTCKNYKNVYDRAYTTKKQENKHKTYRITKNRGLEIEDIKEIFRNVMEANKLKIQYGENVEKCKINTLEGKIVVQKGVVVPRAMEHMACEHIQNLEDRGIIRRSSSNWRNPIRFIEKIDGKLRMVVNLMKLNDLTIKDNYKISTIKEIIRETQGASIFTVIDCKEAFYSVEIEEKDKYKTAFEFKNRVYEWNSMIMGYKNSPMILQRIMEKILDDLLGKGVRVYLDDIIVYAKDKNTHDDLVRKICKRMVENKFVINIDKIQFAKDKIKVLGVEIDGNDIAPLDEHKNKILECKKPKTVKETRQFLGTANYIRQYIPKFSEKTFYLTNSLRVKDPKCWVWTKYMEDEFTMIKDEIKKIESVTIADYEKDFILRTDASNLGVGAVLMQKDNKNEYKVIEYASKKLTDAQKKYGITEKELLGVLFGIEKFEYELRGRTFILETDHKAIEAIRNKADFGNDRIKRWIEKIGEFDFTVKYIKGEDMGMADKLSREDTTKDKRAKAIIIGKENKHIVEHENKRYWKFDSGEVREIPDEANRIEMIRQRHCELGHRNVTCIYYDLKKRYYWFGMKKEIEECIKNCTVCQINNRKNKPQPQYVSTKKPFEKIAIDLMEVEGKYVLIGIDYYTRMIQAEVLRSKTGNDLCKSLEGWFDTGYLPKEIVTDNGREFNNVDFKTMLKKYGIEHRNVSVESHRSNGRVERSIGTMREYIAKMGGNDLENDLEKYVNCYNNTYHVNIKRTPNEALRNYTDLELQECNIKNKKMTNVYRKTENFNIGDIVRVCQKENIEKSKKGRFLRKGKIMHVYPSNAVLVKMEDTERITKKNCSDVKLCKLTAWGGDVTPINDYK